MLDAERLRLQFEKLDERVTELGDVARVDRDTFLSDALMRAAAEFASKLGDMARFRNRLVHLYDEISPVDLYVILQEHLGDFAQFAKYVTEYLESPNDPDNAP